MSRHSHRHLLIFEILLLHWWCLLQQDYSLSEVLQIVMIFFQLFVLFSKKMRRLIAFDFHLTQMIIALSFELRLAGQSMEQTKYLLPYQFKIYYH